MAADLSTCGAGKRLCLAMGGRPPGVGLRAAVWGAVRRGVQLRGWAGRWMPAGLSLSQGPDFGAGRWNQVLAPSLVKGQ